MTTNAIQAMNAGNVDPYLLATLQTYNPNFKGTQYVTEADATGVAQTPQLPATTGSNVASLTQADYSEAPDSFYRAGMELLKRLQYQGKAEFLEKSYVNRCLGKSIYYLNQLKNMDIEKYDYIKNMLKAQYFSDMKILKHKNEKDYFYQKKAYEVFLDIMNEE